MNGPVAVFALLFASVAFSDDGMGDKNAGGNHFVSQVNNALMIISYDLKADALSCYGDMICEAPNLDALAARGMVFDQTVCQGTCCASSQLSLVVNRYLGNRGRSLCKHSRDQGAIAREITD